MTKSALLQNNLCSELTVTILNGETESNAADLNGTSLVAVDIPSGFQGTSLTFKVSSDGTNFVDYKKMIDGLAVTAVISGEGSYGTDIGDFAGYNKIKIVSSAAQIADKIITLKTRPIS